MATGNYFRLIGTEPQFGRFFTESDDHRLAAPVGVISDHFWKREFGTQRTVLGKTMRVNGVAVTITGVARPELFGERVGWAPAFWMPMNAMAQVATPRSLAAPH